MGAMGIVGLHQSASQICSPRHDLKTNYFAGYSVDKCPLNKRFEASWLYR